MAPFAIGFIGGGVLAWYLGHRAGYDLAKQELVMESYEEWSGRQTLAPKVHVIHYRNDSIDIR